MIRKEVLSTRVDLVSQDEALEIIEGYLRLKGDKTKVVFTAYSEFFVNALRDRDFKMALEDADLVTPDGVGPLAAIDFQNNLAASDGVVKKFLKGVVTGFRILNGKVGSPVSGYWLFNRLVSGAAADGKKVFLLGGFGETSLQLKEKLKIKNEGLLIKSASGGRVTMSGLGGDEAIDTINEFKPDLLFVAYGPVKQEKWIMRNKNRLKAKVTMGVGGTFDEALGIVAPAPAIFSRLGLKWLWRLIVQPSRIGRIWKATVVFAYLVFRESLRK